MRNSTRWGIVPKILLGLLLETLDVSPFWRPYSQMKSAFEVQILHYNGNIFRSWGWVTLEKKLKIFLILTDFYKIIWYQEKLVRKYESVSGRYRPYRLYNVISLASVPNCKSCCNKLTFKEQWWPQGSPSKGKVRRGPRRRSRTLFRWWTLNRELWTRPQNNISVPFAPRISFMNMACI